MNSSGSRGTLRGLLVACAVTLVAPSVVAYAGSARVDSTFTMFGAVCGRPTGQSIAGAAVAAAGMQTTSAANGAYTLTVPSAMHLYTQVSALGYQSTGLMVLTNRAGGLMTGRAPYSFCFSQSLANAFHSLNNTVSLTPFSQLQTALRRHNDWPRPASPMPRRLRTSVLA